jgi:undecaprenyl-diphosphatase
MPSTHTLAAFLFFATLCVVVMLNLPTGRHMKRWLAILSTLAILAVGYSRVYLGVHWVGDVLAAFLLGGAWWAFTTVTYFGSVTEERRVAFRATGPWQPPAENAAPR